jgi:hypothetical protein
MHRTVELSGKPYTLAIHRQSLVSWRVRGEVEGEVVAVAGPTCGSAITRWVEKVRGQLYPPRPN